GTRATRVRNRPVRYCCTRVLCPFLLALLFLALPLKGALARRLDTCASLLFFDFNPDANMLLAPLSCQFDLTLPFEQTLAFFVSERVKTMRATNALLI